MSDNLSSVMLFFRPGALRAYRRRAVKIPSSIIQYVVVTAAPYINWRCVISRRHQLNDGNPSSIGAARKLYS